ncbi:MAG: peptidoglycan-binding domain-containing protein, partial [Xanthomonadales bacterium]|nr:peptidoglycan-binding domain-containing protein [Xanthomonadales bacterium]
MGNRLTLACCLLALSVSANVFASDPELVKMAQMDLIALGYEPGNIQGELDTPTIVAVSKFQAENNMEVTG